MNLNIRTVVTEAVVTVALLATLLTGSVLAASPAYVTTDAAGDAAGAVVTLPDLDGTCQNGHCGV